MKKILLLFILHSSLFTLHFSLFTLHSSAAVPLKWTVETSRLQPVAFDAVRGETLALEASFNSYGKPLQLPSNAALFYQTNGMGTAWWSVPAAVTSNRISAVFAPTNDPGASVVMGFLGSTGEIYSAAFTLRFRHGPGATPNMIELPVRTLDFATITVLNPPWTSGGTGGVDANAVNAIIASSNLASVAYVDAATNGLATSVTSLASRVSGLASDVTSHTSQLSQLSQNKQDKIYFNRQVRTDTWETDAFLGHPSWTLLNTVTGEYATGYYASCRTVGTAVKVTLETDITGSERIEFDVDTDPVPSTASSFTVAYNAPCYDSSATWTTAFPGPATFTATYTPETVYTGAETDATPTADSTKLVTSGGVYGFVTNSIPPDMTSSKRDLTNNVCSADGFTPWSATLPAAPSGGDWESQPTFDTDNSEWRWYYTSWYAESGNSDPDATSVTFSFTNGSRGTVTFPATRAHAAISNDTFATYAFVTNAVATATPDFTTNNLAFVKGVTNVVDTTVLEMVANSANTNAVAILNETLGKDWTTYGGGLAGLLAAILAALAVLKKGKANISDFTLGSFASYVSSLFSGDNTSLMGVVRYANEAKSGSDMAATTAYAISTAYAVGDYILHDSTNYVCITAVTADANTDWDTVASSFATRTAKTAQMADRTTNAVTVTNATMNITFPAAVTDKMRDFLVYIDATGYVAGGKFTVTLPTGADQYGDEFPSITATGEHLIAITEIAANKFYVKAIELESVTQ